MANYIKNCKMATQADRSCSQNHITTKAIHIKNEGLDK